MVAIWEGTFPVNLLLSRPKVLSDFKFPSEGGMLPDIWFELNLRYTSLFRLPSSGGIVLVSLFQEITKRSRAERSPSSGTRFPERFLLIKITEVTLFSRLQEM